MPAFRIAMAAIKRSISAISIDHEVSAFRASHISFHGSKIIDCIGAIRVVRATIEFCTIIFVDSHD